MSFIKKPLCKRISTVGNRKLKAITRAATKPAVRKSKKKAAIFKTAAAKPTTCELLVSTQSPTSSLDEISDLLDHLPIHPAG
jgi:hypothetical protein